MGFLKRLFSGDPQRDLERAEALLSKGEAERALELARRVEEGGEPAERALAGDLARRAKSAVVAAALERASVAETSEYFEDAAEWLGTALEHVDASDRAALEERVSTLLARAREAEKAEQEAQAARLRLAVPEPVADLDGETHYLALIGMLEDEVADRYEAQPAAFRRAYVDLNEGRVAEALAALDEVVAAGSDDPAVRLERGRCRLMLGDAEGALADFEAARPAFGEASLDLGGEVSVPGLWAEAMLVLGRPEPVIEGLADLADPGGGRPALSYRYAQALLMTERFDDARRFLAAAASRYPGNPAFPEQLAFALDRLGDRAAAIDCLETAIAPSCAGGRCGQPSKHLPSIRALAALYLAAGERPERVHQLMTLVVREQGGHLNAEDHALMARYHQQVGDPEAAEDAAAEARRLQESGSGDAPSPSAPVLGGQSRAPI